MSTANVLQQPFNILLVEDNEDDALIARHAFRNVEVDIALNVACDGVEALEMLRKQAPYEAVERPDLVLLDLNMPRMDGREMLAIMKNDKELQSIPVVVLTTSDASIDVNQAYDAHANAYMIKPIDFKRFNEMVEGFTDYWLRMAQLPRRDDG